MEKRITAIIPVKAIIYEFPKVLGQPCDMLNDVSTISKWGTDKYKEFLERYVINNDMFHLSNREILIQLLTNIESKLAFIK